MSSYLESKFAQTNNYLEFETILCPVFQPFFLGDIVTQFLKDIAFHNLWYSVHKNLGIILVLYWTLTIINQPIECLFNQTPHPKGFSLFYLWFVSIIVASRILQMIREQWKESSLLYSRNIKKNSIFTNNSFPKLSITIIFEWFQWSFLLMIFK